MTRKDTDYDKWSSKDWEEALKEKFPGQVCLVDLEGNYSPGQHEWYAQGKYIAELREKGVL